MALIETLIGAVAPSITKTVLKLWAADHKVIVESGTSAVDILSKVIPDILARKEADRQFAAIGERAAQSLQFIFSTEGTQLFADEQQALAELLAETLDRSQITVDLLIAKDLDPAALAAYFMKEASDRLCGLPSARIQLFERVIGEASESIIDIAHDLPTYSERTNAELLRRSRVLVDAADRILDGLDRIRSQVDGSLEFENIRFETEYRRAAARNLNRMELFGIDLSRASKSHPLDVAYISLDVSSTTIAIDARESGNSEHSELPVQSIELALFCNPRILIKGPAGSGKTTLTRWIAVSAGSSTFPEQLDQLNGAVPFVIRLRHFADSRLPGPESFTALVAQAVADEMPSGWVHRALRSGRAIVVVDGVDEVPSPRHDEVRYWLNELCSTFPHARFVVTSRPHAVEEGWLAVQGFSEAFIQPLDNKSVEKLIDRWHQAVAAEAQHEGDLADLPILATKLKKTLAGNGAVRRLATNPLLCAVICALHRDSNQQLPEDRLDLYRRCCEMLIERRDRESGFGNSGYVRLTYREKRTLLDDLAYWMVKNGWSEVAVESACARLERRIPMLRASAKNEPPVTAQNVLRLFVDRSGILREPVPNKIDFAHRNFQEFMAAHAAVEEADFGILAQKGADADWREVAILASGLARPSERTDFINALLSAGDSDPKQRERLHLLAAACVEIATDVDPQVRRQVTTRISKIVPPRTLSEATQLAEAAGDLAVPFLKPERWRNVKEQSACIRALALIGSLEAVQVLAQYAKDIFYGVQREVVRSSHRVDEQLFLDIIAPHLKADSLPGDVVAQLLRDFGLKKIPQLESATRLKLSSETAITDLAMIQQVPKIQELELNRLGDVDLAFVAGTATHLRVLSVSYMDLRRMPLLSTLEHLSVSEGSVDLAEIVCLPQLRTLTLADCELSNAMLLNRLRQLTSLSLFRVELPDFSVLAGLESLESLLFWRGSPEDTNLPLLPRLRSLELGYKNVADVGSLILLPSLERLDLKCCNISASQLRILRQTRRELIVNLKQ